MIQMTGMLESLLQPVQARQEGGRERGMEEGQSLSKAVWHAINTDGLGKAQNAWRSLCKQWVTWGGKEPCEGEVSTADHQTKWE